MSGAGLAAGLSAREFPERLLVQGMHDQSYRSSTPVTSARNLAPRNSDGSSSDPYCIIYYGDKKERTKHVQKTVNPIWNESFVFFVDAKAPSLKIEVRMELVA